MRTPAFPARQRGFSLIEMVAAFVVFALGFGVLMGILTASIRNTRLAADYTQAALWAQTRLDVVGIGEKLEPGRKSGRFDDAFRWELEISKYEPPDPTTAANVESFQGIDMFRVDLEVLWGERRNPRSAHFVTLRSANADAGVTGGGSGGADMSGEQPPGSSSRDKNRGNRESKQ